MEQLVGEDVWDDGVQHKPVVYEKQPHLGVAVLRVAQHSMCCYSNGILSGPICTVCKLMRVRGGWKAGFDVL